MDTQSIEVDVSLKVQDVFRAGFVRQGLALKILLGFFGIMWIIQIIVMFLAILIPDEYGDFLAQAWISLLVIPLAPLFVLGSQYICARSALKSCPPLQGAVKYVFSPLGIQVTTSQSEGTSTWDAVFEARESKSAVLIYQSTAIASVIPKRFLDDAKLTDLRRLLTTALGKKAKLGRSKRD